LNGLGEQAVFTELGGHCESNCSDSGNGIIPHTAQKWSKSFLRVVHVCRAWELSPHQGYCAAWGGGVAAYVPGVWRIVGDYVCF